MLHTDTFWINVFIFAGGLLLLVKGSDVFVDGAAFIAKHFNVPKVIIGLTLVSIGTSLPELATDVSSAIRGLSDPIFKTMPMGDALGSDISNILLVLGFSVVLTKRIEVDKLLFKRDTMVMVLVFTIFTVMFYCFNMSDGKPGINRIEGCILLIIFGSYMVSLFKRRKILDSAVEDESKHSEKHVSTLSKAILFMIIGGIMIPVGSNIMVDNVKWAAEKMSIEPQIITATVVAFGTSLPELSVTIAGIFKKETDIALGNIIGSNIFNIVFVMATASLIGEVPCGTEATYILPCLLFAGTLLIIFMRTNWALTRWEGVTLMCCYAFYICINIYFASSVVQNTINGLFSSIRPTQG